MKQRILPASFWTLPQLSLNGGNHAGQTTPATSSSTLPTSSYADLYSDQLQNHANMLNQLPEWWSAQSAQSSYVQRSAASPYYNHTRFHHQPSSQYWAAASRLAASQVKGEWPQDYQAAAQAALTTAAGLHNPASEFTHPYQAAAASLHHYPNMPGKKF